MMYLDELEGESCPDCGAKVLYGTKEKSSSWKVYVLCEHTEDFEEDCTWEVMGGRVQRSEISHIDEVDDKAQEIAKQFTA